MTAGVSEKRLWPSETNRTASVDEVAAVGVGEDARHADLARPHPDVDAAAVRLWPSCR